MGGAQVEDGVGGVDVLDVAVLEVGGRKGVVVFKGGALRLDLSVVQTVRAEDVLLGGLRGRGKG